MTAITTHTTMIATAATDVAMTTAAINVTIITAATDMATSAAATNVAMITAATNETIIATDTNVTMITAATNETIITAATNETIIATDTNVTMIAAADTNVAMIAAAATNVPMITAATNETMIATDTNVTMIAAATTNMAIIPTATDAAVITTATIVTTIAAAATNVAMIAAAATNMAMIATATDAAMTTTATNVAIITAAAINVAMLRTTAPDGATSTGAAATTTVATAHSQVVLIVLIDTHLSTTEIVVPATTDTTPATTAKANNKTASTAPTTTTFVREVKKHLPQAQTPRILINHMTKSMATTAAIAMRTTTTRQMTIGVNEVAHHMTRDPKTNPTISSTTWTSTTNWKTWAMTSTGILKYGHGTANGPQSPRHRPSLLTTTGRAAGCIKTPPQHRPPTLEGDTNPAATATPQWDIMDQQHTRDNTPGMRTGETRRRKHVDQPGEAHAHLPDPAPRPALMTPHPDTKPGTPHDAAARQHQNETRESQPNIVTSNRDRLNLAIKSHKVVNSNRLNHP